MLRRLLDPRVTFSGWRGWPWRRNLQAAAVAALVVIVWGQLTGQW
jgi:hypothetical protein